MDPSQLRPNGDVAHLRIIGSRCLAHIDAGRRVRAEKLEARATPALFLGYKGDHGHNYRVWLLDTGRWLRTPHVIFHENVGCVDDIPNPLHHPESSAPNPKDVIRSLPEYVQKRLKARAKNRGETVKNQDLNMVDSDITEEKNG